MRISAAYKIDSDSWHPARPAPLGVQAFPSKIGDNEPLPSVVARSTTATLSLVTDIDAYMWPLPSQAASSGHTTAEIDRPHDRSVLGVDHGRVRCALWLPEDEYPLGGRVKENPIRPAIHIDGFDRWPSSDYPTSPRVCCCKNRDEDSGSTAAYHHTAVGIRNFPCGFKRIKVKDRHPIAACGIYNNRPSASA